MNWKDFKIRYCILCETFYISCNYPNCHGTSCNGGGCINCVRHFENFKNIRDFLNDQKVLIFFYKFYHYSLWCWDSLYPKSGWYSRQMLSNRFRRFRLKFNGVEV